MKIKAVILGMVFILSGCAPATFHRQQVRDDSGERITVGRVQKEIKVGMSSAKVAEILGAPNVVTTGEERREVWIYDKIATDIVYSQSNARLKFLTSGSAEVSSTSQRTLTIIIKFGKEGKVRDFAYHASQF